MNDDNNQIVKEKLDRSIKVCSIHIKRLNFAIKSIKELFPLNVEKFESLSQLNIQAVDQFIYRFIKLQDEIGTKTFKFLLLNLKEDVDDKPFIDIIARLEKLNIIESESIWFRLRELRNELTHEYPEMINDRINGINGLFKHISELELIFNNIVLVAKKYRFI